MFLGQRQHLLIKGTNVSFGIFSNGDVGFTRAEFKSTKGQSIQADRLIIKVTVMIDERLPITQPVKAHCLSEK